MSRTQGLLAMSLARGLWADADIPSTPDAAEVSSVERTGVQPLPTDLDLIDAELGTV